MAYSQNLGVDEVCHQTVVQLILFLTAFVTTLLKNASAELWVGLTSDSKANFKWAQAGLLSYTNWAPGEPLDNSGPHQNKTPVLTLLFMSWLCHQSVPLLNISLSPFRETVWWCIMKTGRRKQACGLLEHVRWKVMASSVKDNKVW